MRILYLLILPAAALLALGLWYALVVGWSVVLGRMGRSISTWDELEEDLEGLGGDRVATASNREEDSGVSTH